MEKEEMRAQEEGGGTVETAARLDLRKCRIRLCSLVVRKPNPSREPVYE